MWFCYRFLKIDFESVANYYAFNASEEMKKAIKAVKGGINDVDTDV